MVEIFPDLKIAPQEPLSATLLDANSPYLNSTRLGFPYAKKHLIIQIVQLLQFDHNYTDAIKYNFRTIKLYLYPKTYLLIHYPTIQVH